MVKNINNKQGNKQQGRGGKFRPNKDQQRKSDNKDRPGNKQGGEASARSQDKNR